MEIFRKQILCAPKYTSNEVFPSWMMGLKPFLRKSPPAPCVNQKKNDQQMPPAHQQEIRIAVPVV